MSVIVSSGVTIDSRQALLVLVIHRPEGIEPYGPYLSMAGFRVAEAHNGQEGFSQAVALAPDFIVLDFDVNGETVALLRDNAMTHHIPIIALAELARLGRS